MNTIDMIQKNQPLIHCMTNQVVMNFTANGLLAIGASPVMTVSIHEASEMVEHANGLLLNMGTPTTEQVDAMIVAGKRANELNIPVVFDPVGVGATSYRNDVATKILQEVKVTVIRGNGGEIATLAKMEAEVKGVSGYTSIDPKQVAKKVAKMYDTIVAMTGEMDVVSDGKQSAVIKNGHCFLEKVVGTGCLLGAVVAAFLTNTNRYFESTVEALLTYAIAGEIAYVKAGEQGIGSYQIAFLNQLHQVTHDDVLKKQCMTMVSDE